MELPVCGYFKRSHPSQTFLVALSPVAYMLEVFVCSAPWENEHKGSYQNAYELFPVCACFLCKCLSSSSQTELYCLFSLSQTAVSRKLRCWSAGKDFWVSMFPVTVSEVLFYIFFNVNVQPGGKALKMLLDCPQKPVSPIKFRELESSLWILSIVPLLNLLTCIYSGLKYRTSCAQNYLSLINTEPPRLGYTALVEYCC